LVDRFSETVFKLGGHIIHGSHPTFTETLLRNVDSFQSSGGTKDALTLAVSLHWSKDPKVVPTNEWRTRCLVYETPEVPGSNSREDSLDVLRKWMASRCDVIVAIGGRWWEQVAGKSGVPIEVELAQEKGLSCFLLGGPGGAVHSLLEKKPQILSQLRNGLTESENRALATETNIELIIYKVCEQMGRLPLVRKGSTDGVTFRVLALDGGGVKGAFEAAALATWENQTGLHVADHFDLIAGTSTGGILAIGLGLGLSANEILDFYRKSGPEIFPTSGLIQNFRHQVAHWFSPKFSQDILFKHLKNAYYGKNKPKVLSESKCRLVIPSYHALAGASHTFRTPHHPSFSGDGALDAAQVALASAAAPTYFAAAKVENMIAESEFIDGGVWANSPVMAALVEATCYLKIELDRVDVLSIGTTEEPFTIRKKTRSGILHWNKELITLLMNAQVEVAQQQARLLIGDPGFIRVNTMTQPGTYSLDSPKEIEGLIALGNLEASKPEVLSQVKSRFLNGVKAIPWDKY